MFFNTLCKVAAAAKSLQSCSTLCDPIDGSPPGSPIPGILQARTLEWVAIFFSNAWKSKVKVKSLSRIWLLATPWTAAYQVPPSRGSSRQEHQSGVPLEYNISGTCQSTTVVLKKNTYGIELQAELATFFLWNTISVERIIDQQTMVIQTWIYGRHKTGISKKMYNGVCYQW